MAGMSSDTAVIARGNTAARTLGDRWPGLPVEVDVMPGVMPGDALAELYWVDGPTVAEAEAALAQRFDTSDLPALRLRLARGSSVPARVAVLLASGECMAYLKLANAHARRSFPGDWTPDPATCVVTEWFLGTLDPISRVAERHGSWQLPAWFNERHADVSAVLAGMELDVDAAAVAA